MGAEAFDELVVLTQNAWGGAGAWEARRDLLAKVIAAHRPHVVGLQEVHAPSVSGATSQAHQIAARIGGYDTFFAPGRVRHNGSCEGVAILCRHGVREHAVEALTLDPEDPWDGESQRVVLCAQLDLPVGPVDVFVTHLSLSAKARHRTVRELLAFTARERRRSGSVGAVLMGDLNATPDDPAFGALVSPPDEDQAWLDVWSHAHGDAKGGTWPALFPFRRIDYQLVQPLGGWHVLACQRLRFAGSDHLGVLARLKLLAGAERPCEPLRDSAAAASEVSAQVASEISSTSSDGTQKRVPSGATT